MITLIRLSIIALTVVLTIAFLWGAFLLLPYLMPFLIALTFAVLIEPINILLMRWKRINRIIAVAITNTLFLVLVLGLIALGGTKAILELVVLFQKLPNYFLSMENDALELFQRIRNVYLELPPEVVTSINDTLKSVFEWSRSFVGVTTKFLVGLVSALPGILIVSLIMIVAFVLISYGLPQIKKQFLNLFSVQAQNKVNHILNDLNTAIIGFVRAQLILSLMTYVLALIGLLILGVNYALAIALIIMIVDILPILGTGSVLVPWSIYLFYHGDNTLGIGLIVLFIALTIIRRIVEPKILGDSIGLSALGTIVSLYLGIAILGGWGIFLGPILFIIIKSLRRVGLLNFKFHF